MPSSFIKIFRLKRSNKDCDTAEKEIYADKKSNRVPTVRSSKDGFFIGGVSWNRPSAPYSIITSPKKAKKSRSCPGGVQTDRYSNLTLRNSNLNQQNAKMDSNVKTSEYGSCEQSPTNTSEMYKTYHETDYSEQSAKVQVYECELRRLKRRLKEERIRYKEQIASLQNDNERLKFIVAKASRSVSYAQRTVEYERHKNSDLKKKLRNLEGIVLDLQTQVKNAINRDNRAVQPNSFISDVSGAGEALYLLTQSDASLFTDESTSQMTDLNDNTHILEAETCATANDEISRSWEPYMNGKEYQHKGINAQYGTYFIKSPRRKALRRSFSDSQLLSNVNNNELNDVPHRFSPPVPEEYYYTSDNEPSLSSDSEIATAELIRKQLRHRGDCVRFIPPRRTVREATFRKFGKKERSALAEFDYLLDLSTDPSAIASSPDHIALRFKKRDTSGDSSRSRSSNSNRNRH